MVSAGHNAFSHTLKDSLLKLLKQQFTGVVYARGPGFFFFVAVRSASRPLSERFSSPLRDVDATESTEGAGVAVAAEN